MGDDPPDWLNSQGFPPKGGLPSDRDATSAQHRGEIGVSTIAGGNVVRGTIGGRNIRPTPPTHYNPIYCDLSDTGSVSGGGAQTRSAGDKYMVVSRRIGLGWSTANKKISRVRGVDESDGRCRQDKVMMWRG